MRTDLLLLYGPGYKAINYSLYLLYSILIKSQGPNWKRSVFAPSSKVVTVAARLGLCALSHGSFYCDQCRN